MVKKEPEGNKRYVVFNAFGEITKDFFYRLEREMRRVLVGSHEDHTKIHPVLQVSSRGGSCEAAIAAYSFLSILPQELITVGYGCVDSAAAILYLAGKRRLATRTTRFMFHYGSFSINGAPWAEFERVVAEHRSMRDIVTEIYVKVTGQEHDAAQKILERGIVYSAAKAKAAGIVHQIVTSAYFNDGAVSIIDGGQYD